MREFRSSGHLWDDGEIPECNFCGKDFDNVKNLYETPYNELCCDSKEYDNFPKEVKAIVDTYDDNENLYEECHRIQKELEHIGWTCDYGLDGEVYYVRAINITIIKS